MKFNTVDDRTIQVFHAEFRSSINNDNIHNVVLDFGDVRVDSTAVINLRITNDTWSEESYEINRDPIINSFVDCFHFDKYSWYLEPERSKILKVRYKASVPNENNTDYFTIVTGDGKILKLLARAKSFGPNVSISVNELSIACCLNENAKKRIKIVNSSEVPAIFMIDVDEKQSAFRPDPLDGCIDGNSYVYIVITFAPEFAGCYVSHLPILIHHQEPIILRLFGYCDEQHKQKKAFNIPALGYPLENDHSSFEEYMMTVSPIRTSVFTNSSKSHQFSLSKAYIDFGKTDLHCGCVLRCETPRTTCFANNSPVVILVKWDEDVEGIFTLKPKKMILRPGETCVVEAHFKPTEKKTFYERVLTAFICFKRSDSSMPIDSFFNTASLHLLGNTFPSDSSTWIPQYDVPHTVVMPSCLPSSPIYATFLIKRFGHLPIMYRFIPPHETCFTVKPMQGIIRRDYQIIAVEMYPKTQDELLYERWGIQFNGNPEYETFIDFRGYAECLSLSFSKSCIEFPSTYPECESTQSICMLNPTRHSIKYKFENIPSKLRINCVEGEIHCNEIRTLDWTFCPPKESHYEFLVSCYYFASRLSTIRGGESGKKIQLSLKGKCERGSLMAVPNEIKFGDQIHGDSKSLSFYLMNAGPVEIPYQLILKNKDVCKSPGEELQLRPLSGSLLPGLREEIQVTLSPRESGHHEVSILYIVRKNVQSNCFISSNGYEEICKVTYFSCLPVMKVEDLLHHRLGHGISKYVLWRLLNINQLNRLIEDLQNNEIRELTMRPPPMILQQEKSIIKLLISNPSSSTVNWTFKQVKLCSCVKISEKRGISFHAMTYKCPHRQLCTFYPKAGSLQPKEKSTITMEIRFELVGKTIIKWDLALGYNRHIHIFINIDCLSGFEKIAFPLYGSTFELDNIFIGDRNPINQILWIYNPTKSDISYSLDTSVLQKINQHHRNEIMKCETPSGTVKQFSHEPIIFKFKPHCPGIFEIKVPLTIGTEMTEITIKGECVNYPITTVAKITGPRQDLFYIDELPVYFNTDNVDLSLMPLHSRATKIIMIHNRLTHNLIAYKWKSYEIPGILKIDLEPQTGRIQGGSLQTFRLVVSTRGKPCRINADVSCEFMNQSEKRDYERSLIMNEILVERANDYFTITEKGTTHPKPEKILLKEPKPFYKVLTVRCSVFSPRDEAVKITPSEKLKFIPAMEIPIDKRSASPSMTTEQFAISTFILEGMTWDVLQNPNIYTRTKSILKYSQIAVEPLKRARVQRRSYVKPSGPLIEKLLENMIFMIVHKEFSLDMIHLTHKSDARQATYPKIWQQVPGHEGRLEQSPQIQ